MLAAVTLDQGGDIKEILVYAAIAGLVGAIVGELITARGRSGESGGVEAPRWRDSKRWYDLGSIAALPIGAVAGCVAGLLFVPEREVLVKGVATSTIELKTLLGTTLIAGVAGAAFLRVLADRFVAVAKTKELKGVLQSTAATLPGADQSAAISPAVVEKIKNATSDAAATGVAQDIAEGAAANVQQVRTHLLEAASGA